MAYEITRYRRALPQRPPGWMRQIPGESRPYGFGLSLKPPSWLIDAIKEHAQAVVRGTVVSVPTEAGTLSFDLSDPKQWAAIYNMLKGITVTRQPATPSGGPGLVERIPGGWGTLALVGLGFIFLPKILRAARG